MQIQAGDLQLIAQPSPAESHLQYLFARVPRAPAWASLRLPMPPNAVKQTAIETAVSVFFTMTDERRQPVHFRRLEARSVRRFLQKTGFLPQKTGLLWANTVRIARFQTNGTPANPAFSAKRVAVLVRRPLREQLALNVPNHIQACHPGAMMPEAVVLLEYGISASPLPCI